MRSTFNGLLALDRWLFSLVQRGPAHPMDRPLLACALHGPIAAVLCMLVAGLCGGATGRRVIPRCLAAVALLYALVEGIGHLAERGRPFEVDPSIRPLMPHSARRSFPSRHVASAAAIAVIVKTADASLGLVAAALTAGIALGRVRAGLHYPSDVAAGAALGYVVGRALRG